MVSCSTPKGLQVHCLTIEQVQVVGEAARIWTVIHWPGPMSVPALDCKCRWTCQRPGRRPASVILKSYGLPFLTKSRLRFGTIDHSSFISMTGPGR